MCRKIRFREYLMGTNRHTFSSLPMTILHLYLATFTNHTRSGNMKWNFTLPGIFYRTTNQNGDGTRVLRWKFLTIVSIISFVLLYLVLQNTLFGPVTAFSPISLNIQRSGGLSGNAFPNLDVTVNSPAAIEKLYETMLSLPKWPEGTYFCPIDNGLVYILTFHFINARSETMQYKPTGCASVILSDGSVRETNGEFPALFAQTIGIPELSIWVRPNQ